MDLCVNGDFADFLVKKAFRLSEEEQLDYFCQMIAAVEYIHSLNYCHLDIKPENMLLGGIDGNTLKLSDFGFSTLAWVNDKSIDMTTPYGTPPYMAPELFDGHYDGRIADMWSCGISLYLMLVGTLPFRSPTHDFKELIAMIHACDLPLPETISPEKKEVLLSLICVDTEQRVKAAAVKQLPWISRGWISPRLREKQAREASHKLLPEEIDMNQLTAEASNSPLNSPTRIGAFEILNRLLGNTMRCVANPDTKDKPEYARKATCFFTTCSAEETLRRVEAVLLEMKLTPEPREGPVLKIIDGHTSLGAISFAVMCRSLEEQLLMVDFQKTRGSAIELGFTFDRVVYKLKDIIYHGGAAAAGERGQMIDVDGDLYVTDDLDMSDASDEEND